MKENNKFRIVATVVVIISLIAFAFFSYNTNNNKNYEEATKEKIEAFNVTNEVNVDNKYSLKNIEDKEIASLYYNDYKNMIVNFPDEAYEMLTNKNISKDEFLNLREKIIKNYYSYSYNNHTSYEDTKNNCMVYRVADNQGKVFVFRVYATMQYEVNITL